MNNSFLLGCVFIVIAFTAYVLYRRRKKHKACVVDLVLPASLVGCKGCVKKALLHIDRPLRTNRDQSPLSTEEQHIAKQLAAWRSWAITEDGDDVKAICINHKEPTKKITVVHGQTTGDRVVRYQLSRELRKDETVKSLISWTSAVIVRLLQEDQESKEETSIPSFQPLSIPTSTGRVGTLDVKPDGLPRMSWHKVVDPFNADLN